MSVIGFFGGLGTLGLITIRELLNGDFSDEILIYYLPRQKNKVSQLLKEEIFSKGYCKFISYDISDLDTLLRNHEHHIIVDLIGSYNYSLIYNISVPKIKQLVMDNFTFHAILCSKYFQNTYKKKRLILVTSKSVYSINQNQSLYNALKSGVSNMIQSINKGFVGNNNKIIEYKPSAFKSNIFHKADCKIPEELYCTFKEPEFYAHKLVKIIKNELG